MSGAAPKVTEAEVKANIIHQEIVEHVSHSGQILRWAILTTQNGFAVTGTPSASVSPKNDDPKLGAEIATKNAMNVLWPMMGYALREQINAEQVLLDQRAFVTDHTVMDTYIGTKVVNASPMTRAGYNLLRGWELPKDENGDDEGYLVEYTDRIENPPHVPGFQGYVSWSPKEVFERAYRRVATASASEPAKPEAVEASDEDQYQLFEGVGAIETKKSDTSWLSRLKIEEAEVKDRFMKLAAFIEGSHHFELLPKDQQQDLREQLSYMRGYKMILERRIVKAGIMNPLL